MARIDVGVKDYYDRHTPAFVALGQGGRLGAIHRAVWGPGIKDRSAAFHYVENRIAELIRSVPPSSGALHIVDLGCGVGASLRYLAELLPIRGTGITLSPVQAGLAASRIREAGLSDRLECIQGDYADLPRTLAQADLAFAIESFVHAPEPALFFEQCARLVRRGGLLAICDDFRRPSADPAAVGAIAEFRRGWHVNTLATRSELAALARAEGFEQEWTLDLSPYLELHRARDRFVDALLSLLRPIPLPPAWVDHLYGGRALQKCLARGWVGYDLAVFRRSE